MYSIVKREAEEVKEGEKRQTRITEVKSKENEGSISKTNRLT